MSHEPPNRPAPMSNPVVPDITGPHWPIRLRSRRAERRRARAEAAAAVEGAVRHRGIIDALSEHFPADAVRAAYEEAARSRDEPFERVGGQRLDLVDVGVRKRDGALLLLIDGYESGLREMYVVQPDGIRAL